MLRRDQRLPPTPTDLIDGPSSNFARREMVSEAEITRPHNPTPELDIRTDPSHWHVQLELRPEQLVALHRLGFTGGALAWREGMPGWQPLRVGSESDSDPEWIEPSDQDEDENSGTLVREGSVPPPNAKRGFVFPARAALVQANPVAPGSVRPPPPPTAQEQVLNELLAPPLPPAPRLPAFGSPHAPGDVLYEPPLRAEPYEPERAYPPPAPLALVPKPAWLTQSAETPVSIERSISLPPPTVIDASHRLVSVKALSVGLLTAVVLSASIAAGVSTLMWRLQGDEASAELLAKVNSAIDAAKSQAAARSEADTEAPPQPTAVSVDQLPLLSGTRAAAPVVIPSLQRPSPPREEPKVSRAPSPPPAPPPPRAVEKSEPAPARQLSALDQKIAEVASQSSDEPSPRRAEPAPTPAEPGPPDRGDIARAVAQAASAARSCGTSPEDGTVMVKFSSSGSAQSIQLVKPFSNRDVNACVLRAMSRARVTPFVGEAVSVRKSVRW